MYTQYQQYQNQNNQYQQQATSGWASQGGGGGGAQWNGTSWVYPGNNAQQQYQQHQQRQQQQKQQVIPPNPIQTFTQYYHGWTKREEELKKQVMNRGTEVERQTAESNRKWAKYYAEESSRAAHHFHQYPQATSAPFDLPAAPPTAESLIHNNKNDNTYSPLKKSSTRNNANENKSVSTMQKLSGRSSGSITTYVRRNIERTEVATDPKLKAFVQSQVEKQIAAALQKGDLQSRNWDLEPLIALPFEKTASTPSTEASSNSPGSMKRYVQRNIERPDVAGDPTLKSYVQSQIEKNIAAAIQKGNLQSKNWDLEPLISLPFQNASAEASKQFSPQPGYNRYYQQQNQPFEGGTSYKSSRSISPENRNDGNSSSRINYYGPSASPAASLSASSTTPNKCEGNESKSSGSYYGPTSSHNTNSDCDSQYRDSINENNYNTFSSSRFTGKNKHGKRSNHYQQHQTEEDFIAFGHYGPTSSSPETLNTGNKKSKKWHRKNKVVAEPTTAVVTMHNDGMDYSQLKMDKRASRFSGRGGINDAISANYRSSNGMHNNSKNDRFMGKGTIGGSNKELDEIDFEKMTVKGTSTTLEKEYLRLTAPPRAEFVRPFYILKQHLRNLQSEYYRCRSPEKACDDHSVSTTIQERMKTPQVMWFISDDNEGNKHKSENPGRRHDYLWFCSQLKAIRQDCTVQRIQGDLAVDVYETHARIALQEGDLNEYNQCQTQLKELYETSPRDSVKGSVVQETDKSSSVWKHEEEFIAYRLLYYVFLSTNEKYSGGSSDMLNIMLSLTPKERVHPVINHALKVREAFASSDYHGFFRLHKSSPNLGVFLTELLVPTMRMRGLRRIAKAYRPSIELSLCLQRLGFCDDDIEFRSKTIDDKSNCQKIDKDSGKIEEGKSWLISCGGVIEELKFVTKDSVIHAPDTETTKNSLI